MDLSMERKLIEQAGTNDVEDFFMAAEPSSYTDPTIRQFTDMGVSRGQAAVGLAYSQQAKLSQAEAVEFATNLKELMSMGYGMALATGALLRNKNNLAAATEMCLSAT